MSITHVECDVGMNTVVQCEDDFRRTGYDRATISKTPFALFSNLEPVMRQPRFLYSIVTDQGKD